MTYEEKIESKKQDRSNALNSKIGIQTAETEAINIDNFNSKFLFGDGTYIGIIDLINLYYTEKNIEKNTTYSKPSHTAPESTWNNQFSDAISLEGDLEFYLDNDDPIGVGDDNLNLQTEWLNGNDELIGSSGLISIINNLDDAIGTTSINGDQRTDNSTYATPALAIAAGNAQALLDIGLGIRGKRTENTLVVSSFDQGGPGPYEYRIGTLGIDVPDYHTGTEKTALLTAISNLINAINSTSTYQIKLTEIYNEIDDIKNQINQIFAEPSMDVDVDDDRSEINTLKSNLDGWVGVSTDNLPYLNTDNPTTLYGFYNWFNGYTTGDNQSNYDTNLVALENLNDITIKNAIETRHNSIDAKLGVKHTNPITDPPQYTKLRKWRYFWIAEKINKPTSSLIIVESMGSAISDANKRIIQANNTLNTLFGTNYELYIPTPTIFTVFVDHIRDDLSVIIQMRTGAAWDGQQHATEYKIYRRPLIDVPYSNDSWGDSAYATYTDINIETGLVKNIWRDTDPTFISGQSFCYRVRTRDTINDSFDSGSDESNVYDNNHEYTFLNITNGIATINTIDHIILKGTYVLILFDNGPTTNDGFYFVSKVKEDVLTFLPTITVNKSAKIYPAPSIIFI